MTLQQYINSLPSKNKLSAVKEIIISRLWSDDSRLFPKPWVASSELLELTQQKYFDRRTRELRDQLGCDVETEYREEFNGHAWRLKSANLTPPKNRDYLSQSQKKKLFDRHNYTCVTCGIQVDAGVRGLQADHKVPLSRGGGNDIINWQPMCNNCNVGKRRACENCTLDCQTCSWAFPEIHGVKAMFSIDEKTLRRIDTYSTKVGESPDKIMESAAEYYLDLKESE